VNKPIVHNIFLAVSVASALFAGAAAAQDAIRPNYYPADYAKIVEASKTEGQLLVYSNMAEFNWAPVIAGFNKLYPWIKVQSVNLQSAEVFTRYNIEAGSNAKTADLLATGSIEGWMNFRSSGNILDYTSPEAGKLPDWSKPFPGLYTVSTDPMILVYNKQTVPEADWPKSMADLAKTVGKHPEYRKSVVTYNGLSAFGAPVHWSWLKRGGDTALAELRTIGPTTVQEESVGTMVTKLSSGEYRLGYFVSGIGVFPKLNGALGRLLGWAFPADGTPVMLRGIAVPKKATNVNAAKLMLDFIVSRSGQAAFGEGGLTPYREDVQPEGKILATYQSIEKQVGADKIIIVGYDPAFLAGKIEFETLWKQIMGQ
jgi:iron(III) transport system substrate-binding protein